MRFSSLLPIVALACSTASAPVVPSTPAGITGRITSIERNAERIGKIRVEERPSETTGSAKAVVTIQQSTDVIGAQLQRLDFNAFKTGQFVRVWFTGPVAESYPVQGTGATVVIDSLSP